MSIARPLLWIAIGALAIGGLPSTAAQDASPDTESAEADHRLELMRRSAGVYRLQTATDPPRALRLHDEPLLRWNNPVSGVKDGIVALWTDPFGRPTVAAQVFLSRDGVWIHEFQSLAAHPLIMSRDGARLWSSDKRGLEMHPLKDAPTPASGAAARLAQMRGLTRQFTAAVDFKTDRRDTRTTHYELRLLARPLYRYAAESEGTLDGALFAFVQGTNPEVFLLLEARDDDSGPRWFYGLAPMTAYRVEAGHPSGVQWEFPNTQADRHRRDLSFFTTHYNE